MNVAEKFKIKKEIAALIKNLAEGELTIPKKFKIKKEIASLVKRLGGEAPESPKGSGNEKLETLKEGGYNTLSPTAFLLLLKELLDAGVELEELKEPAARYIEYQAGEGGGVFDSAEDMENMMGSLFDDSTADGDGGPSDFRRFQPGQGPVSPGVYYGAAPEIAGIEGRHRLATRPVSIYFDGPIGPPSLYRDVTRAISEYSDTKGAISEAAASREITLIMNTGGGHTMTAQQISDALINTAAKKTTAEIHNAHSAGAIIAFSCDEIKVNPQSTVMIHGASISGAGGKIDSLKNHFSFTEKYFDEWFRTLFMGFITEAEMSDLKKGCDLWIRGDEISQRLANWTPLRQRKGSL